MYKMLFATFIACFAFGCTSIRVEPIRGEENLSQVCVIENDGVEVYDMVQVIRGGFERHNISTRALAFPDESCTHILSYNAKQWWDFTLYMTYADILVENKDGNKIGYAEYKLRWNGGLSPRKWADTQTKLDPVLDKLLQNY